jgi:hypothetical protein
MGRPRDKHKADEGTRKSQRRAHVRALFPPHLSRHNAHPSCALRPQVSARVLRERRAEVLVARQPRSAFVTARATTGNSTAGIANIGALQMLVRCKWHSLYLFISHTLSVIFASRCYSRRNGVCYTARIGSAYGTATLILRLIPSRCNASDVLLDLAFCMYE